ncbi:MAG: CinA family protein [Coriobacteriales bacterium]
MEYTEVAELFRLLTLRLAERGLTLSTMESCTGGLIASLVTDTEGSSAVLKGAFVTYSNEAKLAQGVPAAVIAEHGVYSLQTARAMASACRRPYGADIGIGVTGSFGNPDPANADSVPGQVFCALDVLGSVTAWQAEVGPFDGRPAYKLECAGQLAARLLGLLGLLG